MPDQIVRIDAIVFANGNTTIECISDLDRFWLPLSPAVGWAKFERLEPTKGSFQLCEVRPAHDPVPRPIVSSLGVLWRRQAAIEAHRSISSYQQGLEAHQQSSDQSALGGDRHEA